MEFLNFISHSYFYFIFSIKLLILFTISLMSSYSIKYLNRKKHRRQFMKKITVTKKTTAKVVGGLAKYMSHVLSGAIFWGSDSGSFAWSFKGTNINPWAYSFIYNIAYMGPDIVFSTVVTCLLVWVWPKVVLPETNIKTIAQETEAK